MRLLTKKTRTVVISITSLIDVVLLLLIFFMLTTNFVEQPGMKLDLPETESTVGESTDELTVEVELTEVEANKIFVGQNAVLMNSNGSFVFFGQVTRIAPKVDETKGLLKITLNVFSWKQCRLSSLNSTLQTLRTSTFPLPSVIPNCDFPVLGGVMLLRPGMFVNVHIALSLHKDVVMVPKDAVNYDQDRPYVCVISKDMKARKQYLTLDHEFSTTDAVEVIEGLEVGELVVIRQSDLKNGSLVQIINGK